MSLIALSNHTKLTDKAPWCQHVAKCTAHTQIFNNNPDMLSVLLFKHSIATTDTNDKHVLSFILSSDVGKPDSRCLLESPTYSLVVPCGEEWHSIGLLSHMVHYHPRNILLSSWRFVNSLAQPNCMQQGTWTSYSCRACINLPIFDPASLSIVKSKALVTEYPVQG